MNSAKPFNGPSRETRHVAADSGASSFLALASAVSVGVAFGAGVEIALTRVGDTDEVEVPEWVQLFPAGPNIRARDGRNWTLTDPSILVTAFQANNAALPFDINHATELLAPQGGDAPAQGWIKAIAIRDGLPFAKVDWSKEGADLIRTKKYVYVSPAFRHTSDGRIVALTSAALVTHPALDMPALAQQQPNHPENRTMSLAQRLAATLGLSAGASDDQVYEAVTTQTALARDARDPTKLVPAADLTAALARATAAEATIAQGQKDALEAAATSAVDAAIAEGKIAPAGREHWLSIARATPDAFKTAIASMAPTLTPPTKKLDGNPTDTATGAHGLTDQQVSVARSLGLTNEAYAASLKE